jgi:hypothetical protein
MEILFPKKLARLQYFIRFLIYAVTVFVIVGLFWTPAWNMFGASNLGRLMILGIWLGLLLLKLPCLDMPRLRNMGWSRGYVILIFVPIVNLIFQLMLFTMPPKKDDV